MVDHAYLFQHKDLDRHLGPLESKSGTELRRARLFFSGNIYDNTFFKFQVDFSGNETELKDVYIGLNQLPAVGRLMVGHFKEPLRLSTLTSSKYITFMEREPNDRFAQGRNNGIMVLRDFFGKKLSAQLGAFRNAQNNSNDAFADDGYVLTGRVTGLPIYKKERAQLLHLGAAFSYRKPDSHTYSITVRPEAHLAPKYLNTGELPRVENVNLFNAETAFVNGPISIQAEYMGAWINTVPQNFRFSTYYGSVSYFLTGESKKYQGSYEGFDRVRPNKNFSGPNRGWGAWEIALRYAATDLNDGSLAGGRQTDWTAGLNWYLNPATRLMVNYVWGHLEGQGRVNILQGRLQLDF